MQRSAGRGAPATGRCREGLGHSFELAVAAEGVETAVQLDRLVELGCDYGQEFLWSASPDAAAASWLLGREFALSNPDPAAVEVDRLRAPR